MPGGRQGCYRAPGSPFQSPNAKQLTFSSPICLCPSSSPHLDWLILLCSACANTVQDPDSATHCPQGTVGVQRSWAAGIFSLDIGQPRPLYLLGPCLSHLVKRHSSANLPGLEESPPGVTVMAEINHQIDHSISAL